MPDPQGLKTPPVDVLSTPSSDTKPLIWKGSRVPFVAGSGSLEETISCLEMLSIFHNVPFRRDVIVRAAKQSLKDKPPSLEVTGNLSTLMGFVGTISDIPTAQLSRLSFLCFALVDGGLAMIHDISNGEVRAVLPSFGRVVFDIEELDKWPRWCTCTLV